MEKGDFLLFFYGFNGLVFRVELLVLRSGVARGDVDFFWKRIGFVIFLKKRNWNRTIGTLLFVPLKIPDRGVETREKKPWDSGLFRLARWDCKHILGVYLVHLCAFLS